MDARTLWAAVAEWARQQILAAGRPKVFAGNQMPGLVLLIYSREGDAFRMHGPKLYRQAEGVDGFYEADEPLPSPDDVSHVVVGCHHVPEIGDRYWSSWAAFAGEMRLPG